MTLCGQRYDTRCTTRSRYRARDVSGPLKTDSIITASARVNCHSRSPPRVFRVGIRKSRGPLRRRVPAGYGSTAKPVRALVRTCYVRVATMPWGFILYLRPNERFSAFSCSITRRRYERMAFKCYDDNRARSVVPADAHCSRAFTRPFTTRRLKTNNNVVKRVRF